MSIHRKGCTHHIWTKILISPQQHVVFSWNFKNILKISLETFRMPKLEVWSICTCAYWNFSMLLIIYWLSFAWKKVRRFYLFNFLRRHCLQKACLTEILANISITDLILLTIITSLWQLRLAFLNYLEHRPPDLVVRSKRSTMFRGYVT